MLMILALAMIIGLLLGLLGGGGSIMTVPMLVYLLHIETKTAILTSFVVVGISSLIALIPHAKRNSVCWKSGLLFGCAGMIGAFAGGRLAGEFSGEWLMSLFGIVSLLAGLTMLRSKQNKMDTDNKMPIRVCPIKVPLLRVLFDGFFAGGLTGLVGVGGGFLIVPALSLLVGLPMQGAVGTSLLIIVMNTLAGLIGYSQHAVLDLQLTTLVTAGSIAGSILGAACSGYIKPQVLRSFFGIMVILVAIYVLSQSWSQQFFSFIEPQLTDTKVQAKIIIGLLLFWLLLRIGYWIHKIDNIAFTSENGNAKS